MKKKILVVIAVLAAASVIVLVTGATGTDSAADTTRTITLEKKNITKSVNTTGMVYSTDSTNVYSNMSYPVKSVSVSVGDTVEAGDVLAELDLSSLKADIAGKQATAGAAYTKAQQSLSEAQKNLESYQWNTENGRDSGLVSAQAAVTTAQLDVHTAELDVQTAGNDARVARRNLSDARNEKGDYEEDGATDSQLAALRDTVVAKEGAVEKAQTNLRKAEQNLEKAKTNLEVAKVAAEDSLSTYQDKVKSAELSTNLNDQWLSIEKMQKDLEKGVITAPVSGTITAINAVQGGSGSGLLFVIQDIENLKVVTYIKEYDIDAVGIGDSVIIKADATGDKVFGGTLSKIAPTSALTKNGDVTASTDADYEAEVTVDSQQSGLRIGMNARLSIITDEHKDVYSVPFEAVEIGADGESIVYAADLQGDGRYLAKAVSVETGMETDLYIEIYGENVSDGMIVVKNAAGVHTGDNLNIAVQEVTK